MPLLPDVRQRTDRRPISLLEWGVSHQKRLGIAMQTEHLKVTGMTCGGCTKNVTHALRAIAGVRDVQVSLSDGEATVQYDERVTSPDQLKLAVTGAGYGVDVKDAAHGQQAKGGCCD